MALRALRSLRPMRGRAASRCSGYRSPPGPCTPASPPMKLRCCEDLVLQPCREQRLDLEALITGTDAPRLVEHAFWQALKASEDAPIELLPHWLPVLLECQLTAGMERASLVDRFGAGTIDALVAKGLLIDIDEPASAATNTLDRWHPLSAIAHRHTRWRAVDAEAATRTLEARGATLAEALGPAPPLTRERSAASCRIALDRDALGSTLTGLAARRATCRNFDKAQPLPLKLLALVLDRTYAARAVTHTSEVPVLKRATAAAGGLHALEAYLLVRDVEGLPSGLYHYHPIEHALEPMKPLTQEASSDLARRFVATQGWFESAPVFVVLVARFARNFWKYRRHAKSYRALILDAGHLSHHQYLVATELGLAAFITAAINEGDIEDAFGLDPMQEGVIAVTGFGWRGERMEVLEFDPLKQVWPEWTPE